MHTLTSTVCGSACALALLVSTAAAPAPQAPAGGGALRYLVTLVATTEKEHRVTESKLFRLEQVYAQQGAQDKVAKVQHLRGLHMQQYIKQMDLLSAKFGEDKFAEFRNRLSEGRKRTPKNAEAVERKLKALAAKKAEGQK
ncbi:MAG: hypothetical protein FJ299_07110 [Planctomycetes bacterium]|nr:hypothetical protein [Planctomycetota bacterium]